MSGSTSRRSPSRRRRVHLTDVVIVVAVVSLTTIGGNGQAPSGDAAPPPAHRFAHGAAGTARNGFGGEVAASPTIESWPGTGAGRNGGPFAFIGAQYGTLWSIPPSANNSLGVGYCVMEDVGGEGTVSRQPAPSSWDSGEMARAAALMATFGGDRVVPYGIDASGAYDPASGEWLQPSLFGGGEYTRRRQVAVNFGVKMFVEDVSPSGVAAGRKLARDTAIVRGSGGEFSALRNGYSMAQRMADVAELQHAVGGIHLQLSWGTPGGEPPSAAGIYPLEVRATDGIGKPVGYVPVLQLSASGIDGNRSIGTTSTVDHAGDTVDDLARWSAAELAGWPTWDMGGSMAADDRFALPTNPAAADITDATGIARFAVTIPGPDWELAFHTQAPTADADLYSGTGVQGQITWSGPPQSTSVHQVVVSPTVGRFVIRKALDAADVQGDRDMSGFVFEVTASGAVPVGQFATGADGRTPPIEAGPGDHRITEIGRPAWAIRLSDAGPIAFRFDPERETPGGTIQAEVVYVNVVPTPSITTHASDATDGDKYFTRPRGDITASAPPDTTAGTDTADARPVETRAFGTGTDANPTGTDADPTDAVLAVVDRVTYSGLVPGTPYVARGELVVDDGSCEGWCPTPAAAGDTAFVPDDPDGSIDVRIELPLGMPGGAVGVVVERLVLAASGRIVAEHVDLADPAQTVWFPAIATSLQRDDGSNPPGGFTAREVAVGDAVVDVVDYAGLAAGERYHLEMTLHRRLDDGTCVPTDTKATAEVRPAAHHGRAEVRGAAIPGPGVFVAFERLLLDDQPISAHEDCDDETQTVWARAPRSEPPVAPPPVPPTTALPNPPPTATTPPVTTTPPLTPTPPTTTTRPSTTTPPSTTDVPVTTSPPPTTPLPRTGNSGSLSMAGGALGMMLMGAGLSLIVRARAPIVRSE